MSISFIGAATGVTSATLPTHQAGDLLVAFAFRDGSTTAPTIPAGWTAVTTGAGANAVASVAATLVATGSGTSSGTWTNATSVVFHVYRGVAGVGSFSAAGGTGTTVTYNGLTLQRTNGLSWVVGFAGHASTNTSLQTAPSGMVNRANVLDATDHTVGHDTNGGVTGRSQFNVSVGGTSAGWRTFVMELRGVDSTPPTVATFTPANGATGLSPLSPAVTLTFNEPIVRGTGNFTLRAGSASGTIVETIAATNTSRVTVSGQTVSFTLGNVPLGTTLFLVIDAGVVTDQDGNPFAGISTYSFSTDSLNTATTFSPAVSATTVPVGATTVAVTYSRAVTRGTGTITLRLSSGKVIETFDAATSPKVTYSGSTVTVAVSPTFYEANYYFDIPGTAVIDSYGYAGANLTTYTFRTVAFPTPNFPANPNVADTYEHLGKKWKFNGLGWERVLLSELSDEVFTSTIHTPRVITDSDVGKRLVSTSATGGVMLGETSGLPVGSKVGIQALGGTLRIPNDIGIFNGNYFNGGPGGINQRVNAVVELASGNLLVGGVFTQWFNAVQEQTVSATNLVQLDKFTGTIVTNGAVSVNGSINAMAKQSTGKVIVVGSFSTVAGETRLNVFRLNANGTFDTSFTANTNGVVSDVFVDASDRIYIAGDITAVHGTGRNRAARLLSDGALDTTFVPNFEFYGGSVYKIVATANGTVWLGGAFEVYDPWDIADPEFGPFWYVRNLVPLNSSGQFMAPTGGDYGPTGPVYALVVLSDNNTIWAGSVNANYAYGGGVTVISQSITRWGTNYLPQASGFPTSFVTAVYTLIRTRTNRIVAVRQEGNNYGTVRAYTESGSEVYGTEFWGARSFSAVIAGATQLSDGRFAVWGPFTSIATGESGGNTYDRSRFSLLFEDGTPCVLKSSSNVHSFRVTGQTLARYSNVVLEKLDATNWATVSVNY
jgi:hypothetical protein